jgi:hypothetical protein
LIRRPQAIGPYNREDDIMKTHPWLELNMNNDAAWCGCGGPWITPELSMQRVVWTETVVCFDPRSGVTSPW